MKETNEPEKQYQIIRLLRGCDMYSFMQKYAICVNEARA